MADINEIRASIKAQIVNNKAAIGAFTRENKTLEKALVALEPPKKPGRKPKAATVAKRGPGRPKGSLNVKPLGADAKAATSVVKLVKRGPGRPKKVA